VDKIAQFRATNKALHAQLQKIRQQLRDESAIPNV
jgi:hypothetical protein